MYYFEFFSIMDNGVECIWVSNFVKVLEVVISWFGVDVYGVFNIKKWIGEGVRGEVY